MLKASTSTAAMAKINLFLHVTGKRPDGYHCLESLVGFTEFAHDVVTIQNASDFSFDVTGPFSCELEGQDLHKNLVVMMHDLLQNYIGRPLPCHIKLEKNLPIGAGLGGGSCDAACALRLMESFFNLHLDNDMKRHLMVMIGADVPVCYQKTTSFFSGIGDVVTPAHPLPPTPMLLLWPGVSCATNLVFKTRQDQAFTPTIQPPGLFKNTDSLVDFLKTTANDLCVAAEYLYPEITTARLWMQEQEGCLLARMSGSGSTIFGIFKDEERAKVALENIPDDKNWWAKAGIVT